MALDADIVERWQNADVLVLGGSAGFFRTLLKIVKNFPAGLNKAVIIVIHRRKNFSSEIVQLLQDISLCPVKEVSDKEKIEINNIYIAPANYHTLVEVNGYFSLDVSDAVWYSKPSIDVTFESVAEVYRANCAAIIFSGANPDGARGLLKLKENGALTIAQDPADAEMPDMPNAALNLNAVTYVLRAEEILELLKM